LRWQPRLQGALGYLEASNKFRRGLLDGDDSKYSIFAMQCGGGVRLWWTDHISLAPTITGMYAYTRNSYSANSQFAITHEDLLTQTGLIRWHANTWTVIPGVELQYEYTWHRTVLTLSSTFGFYHTGSFDTSTPNLQMRGDSEMWRNKIDADIPLRIRLLGHELRAGGYFSRTDLAGNLEKGLNVDHIYDIHGRVVLDFLGKFWKLKWLGLGGSYLWGPQFTGWAIGGDVQFKF
jgi:hypothetical protein